MLEFKNFIANIGNCNNENDPGVRELLRLYREVINEMK